MLTEHVTRKNPNGTYRMHYDRTIGEAVRKSAQLGEAINRWNHYDAISCPTLVIRGANSTILSPESFIDMTKRGPRAQTVEIPNTAHSPSLIHADRIAIVRNFLLRQT
jgi:pimeloyl-ACP methyl ester carboxylesterase